MFQYCKRHEQQQQDSNLLTSRIHLYSIYTIKRPFSRKSVAVTCIFIEFLTACYATAVQLYWIHEYKIHSVFALWATVLLLLGFWISHVAWPKLFEFEDFLILSSTVVALKWLKTFRSCDNYIPSKRLVFMSVSATMIIFCPICQHFPSANVKSGHW